MDASDAHLERALEEYNGKVNELESEGPSEQLLEAYVNRGCILGMMEYRTSALEDLESADDLIRHMEDTGSEIDDGTFVKTYLTMGDLLFEQEADPVEAYARAAVRIQSMDPEARHFDFRSTVRCCITTIENLIDSEYSEETGPFFAKAMGMVMTKQDPWSVNRKLELLNLEGEASEATGDLEAAVDSYSRAIETGTGLLERTQLEDTENLVMSFVSKGEAEDQMGDDESYLRDINAAVVLLEEMLRFNRLDDPEILVTLHHNMASTLMKQGKMEEAEKHLMKAMSLGIQGASEYINSQTDKEV